MCCSKSDLIMFCTKNSLYRWKRIFFMQLRRDVFKKQRSWIKFPLFSSKERNCFIIRVNQLILNIDQYKKERSSSTEEEGHIQKHSLQLQNAPCKLLYCTEHVENTVSARIKICSMRIWWTEQKAGYLSTMWTILILASQTRSYLISYKFCSTARHLVVKEKCSILVFIYESCIRNACRSNKKSITFHIATICKGQRWLLKAFETHSKLSAPSVNDISQATAVQGTCRQGICMRASLPQAAVQPKRWKMFIKCWGEN